MPRNQLIQPRNGTAAAWTTANPILAVAEFGVESDTGKFKIGDGATTWNSLAYANSTSGVSTFNTRTGHVTLTKGDVTGTGLAAADVSADVAGAASAAQSAAQTFATSADATVLTTAEGFATAAVGTEATTRAAADTTNANAITNEISRAETAEALLAPKASPALTGTPTAPTQTALTNNTRIATTAYADAAVAVEVTRAEAAETSNATAVTTETSRAMTAEGLLAPKASPALTGTPTAPTQTALNNSTRLATTAYADLAVGVETTRAEGAEVLLAPLASPALTGTPTAPTKTALTNNTDIATTAYADAAVGVETSRATTAEALLAPLASPALTGTPTAPTKSALTNNTDIATTAYADAAVAVETTRAEGAEILLAPLASPALTGNPTVPTQTALTNSTRAASTAYADAAVAVEKARAMTAESLASPVFNVKNYGAVGDGATDDTAAIQSAIYAAQGTSTPGSGTGVPGGSVFFPAGEYKITSTLQLTRFNGIFAGVGMGQSPAYGPQPGNGSVIRWGGTTNTRTATGAGTNSLTFTTGDAATISAGQVVTGAGITGMTIVTAVNVGTGAVTLSGPNSLSSLTASAYVFTAPMIQVVDSWHIEWRDFRLEGDNTNLPAFGIEYLDSGGSNGGNHYCSFQNVWIGQYPWSSQGTNKGNVQICIGYVGTNSNSDQFHMDRVIFSYATLYGLYLPNTQSVWGSIKDSEFDSCGTTGNTPLTSASAIVGTETNSTSGAIGTNADISLFNTTFNRCAIDLITGISGPGTGTTPPTDLPNVNVFGWYSENSLQMMNLSPDAHINVQGGTFQQVNIITSNNALIAAYPSDKLSLTLDSVQFTYQLPEGSLTFTGTTGGTYTGTLPPVGASILPFIGGIQSITGTPVIATSGGGNFTVSGGSVTLAGTNLASFNTSTITFGPQSSGYTGNAFIRVLNCRGIVPTQLVFAGSMWAAGTNPSRCTIEWQSADGQDLVIGTNGIKNVYAFRNELGPSGSGQGNWRQALNFSAWDMPVAALVRPPFKVSVSSNAGTVPVNAGVANFTNSSAAAMTITLTTTNATDGQIQYVRTYDSSGVAQGMTWVGTENGPATVPATSKGSTTLPTVTVFQFNGATSLWRCLVSDTPAVPPTLLVDQASDPAAPAAGNSMIFAKTQAGRGIPHWLGEIGGARSLQTGLGGKVWSLGVAGNSTSVVMYGTSPGVTAVGTLTAATSSANGVLQNNVTSGSANAQAYFRGNQLWRRGTGGDLSGGFFYKARIYLPDASYANTGASTGSYIQAGLSDTFATDLGTAHGTSGNHHAMFCFADDHTTVDTTWHFATCNGTNNVTDTTMTMSAQHVYDFFIFCPLGGSAIYWQVNDLTAATTHSGSTSTDLPSNALAAGFGLQSIDAITRNVQHQSVYTETDV